jgi:hypothetical protein
MHVGMVVQVLPPSVQHQQHADPGAEMLGVGGRIAERGRGGPQEQIVQGGRVGQGQLGDFPRQGEDDVVVLDRQQVFRLFG